MVHTNALVALAFICDDWFLFIICSDDTKVETVAIGLGKLDLYVINF